MTGAIGSATNRRAASSSIALEELNSARFVLTAPYLRQAIPVLHTQRAGLQHPGRGTQTEPIQEGTPSW